LVTTSCVVVAEEITASTLDMLESEGELVDAITLDTPETDDKLVDVPTLRGGPKSKPGKPVEFLADCPPDGVAVLEGSVASVVLERSVGSIVLERSVDSVVLEGSVDSFLLS
jgi:hypothetical protein